MLKTFFKLCLLSSFMLVSASTASANQTELSSDANLSQYNLTSPITVSWKIRTQGLGAQPINATARVKRISGSPQADCREMAEHNFTLNYNSIDGAHASYATHVFSPIANWCLGTYTTEITVAGTNSTVNRTFTVVNPPSNPIIDHNIQDDPTTCQDEESEEECQEKQEEEKKVAEEQKQKQDEENKQAAKKTSANKNKLAVKKLKVSKKKISFSSKKNVKKVKVTFVNKSNKKKKTYSVKVKNGKASRKISLKKGSYRVTFTAGKAKLVKNVKVK